MQQLLGFLFLLFLSIYIQALLAAGPFLLAKKTKRLSCLIFLLKAQQKEEKWEISKKLLLILETQNKAFILEWALLGSPVFCLD